MRNKSYIELENYLKRENINTWFDMGLLLDRIRDSRKPITHLPDSFESYKSLLQNGIAFITFEFGINGVSIEIAKYSQVFSNLIKKSVGIDPLIFWIGGEFNLKSDSIPANYKYCSLKGAAGFDKWDGYNSYFFTRLERGSIEYNQLAKKIWKQTVDLSLRLGEFIADNNINLLIPVNVNSNPGNVPLAFAVVLVSEIMRIPVLNNNHDFYWEDGNPFNKRKKPGLRDQFFTNCHLGGGFSLIEMLYPWDSPSWFQTMINPLQKRKLIRNFGFNPIAVTNISTFIDTNKFKPNTRDQKKEILSRLHFLFAGSSKILHSKSISKFINSLNSKKQFKSPVILGSSDKRIVQFQGANIIILQPTRILKRKQIERNFNLINSLCLNSKFKTFVEQNKQMSLILLISGPISTGQEEYFKELNQNFKILLKNIPRIFRERIFLAFKFGIASTPYMTNSGLNPIGIEEIYAVADLVVLPSKSEGRGLPIIESCASGTPIIVNRYEPEIVFDSVVGENLDKSKRLKVFEFPKKNSHLPKNVIEFFNFPEKSANMLLQNRKNVKKRFGFEALEKDLNRCLYILWRRSIQPQEKKLSRAKKIFEYQYQVTQYDELFKQIVLINNRKYYPGFSPVEFMIILKSLIDPSYFRMEEKKLKGRLMNFAQQLVKAHRKYEKLDYEIKIDFYNYVDALFEYYEGEDEITMDHSLSYRHRHTRHYPFRKLTEYELCGLIAHLFRELVKNPEIIPLKKRAVSLSQFIHSSLMMLGGYRKLAIDDSDYLVQALKSNKPFAWFPGEKWLFEVEIFVVETLKFRLGLSPDDKITPEKLAQTKTDNIGKVFLLVREKTIGSPIYYRNILIWLKKLANSEIRAVYEAGLFQVVKTDVISAGTHLAQLGSSAKTTLLEIKKQGGFIVAVSEENYLTLDLIDLPSFRVGIANHPFLVNYLGIEKKEAFIQWVPAGMSPCLAYPTPVQTAKEFSLFLKSKPFIDYIQKYGEKRVFRKLHENADKYNSPIKEILNDFNVTNSRQNENYKLKFIETKKLIGLHADGLPWSGVLVKVQLKEKEDTNSNFEFHSVFTKKTGKTVLDLINDFEKKYNKKVAIAWNGGYMLNAELIGKLGLPEKYIGSPLSLIIKDGTVISLPLYNKPALITET